jgi:hypothetical protein
MSKTNTPDLDVAQAKADSDSPAGGPQFSASELGRSLQSAADAPIDAPPSESAEDTIAAEGITAWHNNKKITAMWCNSSQRNAYASVQGIGWKRISNANDSSFVTLVALLSLAEQTNANTKLRIEGDGEIHEAYVF